MEEVNRSPKPQKVKPLKSNAQFDFYEAVRHMANQGKKVTKAEWGDRNIYGHLVNERLTLHKADGPDYDWIISEADIAGKDYQDV